MSYCHGYPRVLQKQALYSSTCNIVPIDKVLNVPDLSLKMSSFLTRWWGQGQFLISNSCEENPVSYFSSTQQMSVVDILFRIISWIPEYRWIEASIRLHPNIPWQICAYSKPQIWHLEAGPRLHASGLNGASVKWEHSDNGLSTFKIDTISTRIASHQIKVDINT